MLYAESIQGYAARGKFAPFVPLKCHRNLARLATQIPQAVCEQPETGSSSPLRDKKRKNTTQGGVFLFLVHLQGFEPGTH